MPTPLIVNFYDCTEPPAESDAIEALGFLELELGRVLPLPVGEVAFTFHGEPTPRRWPLGLVSTEELEDAEHRALASVHVYTGHPGRVLFARLDDGRLVAIGEMADPTESRSEVRHRVAVVEPVEVDDLRALGWLAFAGYKLLETQERGDATEARKLVDVPPELVRLGCTEHGWRVDVMLRQLYLALSEESRAVVEGDTLMLPTFIYESLTGSPS